jgi:hypothetical protein
LWDEKIGFVQHAVAYGKEYDVEEIKLEDGYGTILEDG